MKREVRTLEVRSFPVENESCEVKMKARSLTILGTILIASTGLLGCENNEDVKLAEAQACLDTAFNSSAADRCYGLVEGINTEKANLVRCSSHFIAQGFTGQRFANAFQRLKDNPSSGTDPMATVMTYLVFTNTTTTLHTSDNAVTNCTASGVRSMQRLATMAKLATFVATAGGANLANLDPASGSFDQNAVVNAINTLVGSGTTQDKENLGNIAVQVNTAYCNEGSSFSKTEICKNLSNAITSAGGNLQTIGSQLLSQLQAL